MGTRFAAGKKAISQCDRCGQRYLLSALKKEVIKGRNYDLMVCPECWDPDHPQLHLGEFPVDDPQALRDPRPDTTYRIAGVGADGQLTGGSRVFQWGWNPVGGSRFYDASMTPNALVLSVEVGTVQVATT